MFTKNDPRINREGRPKGAVNESSKKMKEAFAMLIENNLDQLAIWLGQIAREDPAKAMDLVIRLSERFIPKLSQQALTDSEGGDLFKNITFKFGDEKDYEKTKEE
jgi:hypothetical protein